MKRNFPKAAVFLSTFFLVANVNAGEFDAKVAEIYGIYQQADALSFARKVSAVGVYARAFEEIGSLQKRMGITKTPAYRVSLSALEDSSVAQLSEVYLGLADVFSNSWVGGRKKIVLPELNYENLSHSVDLYTDYLHLDNSIIEKRTFSAESSAIEVDYTKTRNYYRAMFNRGVIRAYLSDFTGVSAGKASLLREHALADLVAAELQHPARYSEPSE